MLVFLVKGPWVGRCGGGPSAASSFRTNSPVLGSLGRELRSAVQVFRLTAGVACSFSTRFLMVILVSGALA